MRGGEPALGAGTRDPRRRLPGRDPGSDITRFFVMLEPGRFPQQVAPRLAAIVRGSVTSKPGKRHRVLQASHVLPAPVVIDLVNTAEDRAYRTAIPRHFRHER